MEMVITEEFFVSSDAAKNTTIKKIKARLGIKEKTAEQLNVVKQRRWPVPAHILADIYM